MYIYTGQALRRATALVLVVLTMASCSRAVEVPRDQFEAAAGEENAHRIQLADGSHFMAQRFAVTDSTIVIEELHRTDERRKKVTLPIVVPINDIRSIETIDFLEGRTILVAASVITVVVGGLLLLVGSLDSLGGGAN
jgi:hypothetical protein